MKRKGGLLLALIVVVTMTLVGASFFYRVVRTPWGAMVLKKPRPTFGGSYVDTRSWKARDFMQNRELSRQMMEHDMHGPPAREADTTRERK